MGDAVIVAAARTAIGTARKGTLLDVTAFDLAKWSAGEALKRSGIPGGDVDDLMMGEVLQGGGDIARYAAIELGLTEVPGVAFNRHCASGMAPVQSGAASIMAGMDNVSSRAVRSRSRRRRNAMKRDAAGPTSWRRGCRRATPRRPTRPRSTCRSPSVRTPPTSVGITREDMDAWALPLARARGRTRSTRVASRRRSSRSRSRCRDGTVKMFDTDEHPRRESTHGEARRALKPLHPEIEGFGVTAGNSSGLNDARLPRSCSSTASTRRRTASSRSPRSSRGRRSGAQPRDTGLGPIYAIPKALDRAGMTIDDVDLARDQRGVRVGARRRVPAARARPRRSRTSTAPAARSDTRWRRPAPA